MHCTIKNEFLVTSIWFILRCTEPFLYWWCLCDCSPHSQWTHLVGSVDVLIVQEKVTEVPQLAWMPKSGPTVCLSGSRSWEPNTVLLPILLFTHLTTPSRPNFPHTGILLINNIFQMILFSLKREWGEKKSLELHPLWHSRTF